MAQKNTEQIKAIEAELVRAREEAREADLRLTNAQALVEVSRFKVKRLERELAQAKGMGTPAKVGVGLALTAATAGAAYGVAKKLGLLGD